MPRRRRVTLEEIADLQNLAQAFGRAARAKRTRPDVVAFAERLWWRLARLGRAIRDGSVQVGRARRFEVFDPKRRVIHAPVFEERVLHHAIHARVAPHLEAQLAHDVYACRVGKGALAAARRAQRLGRRAPWVVKADVRAYFASVPHDRLLEALQRALKGRGVLRLLERIVRAYQAAPGRGLPIGALTSQLFGTWYLAPLDRRLLEDRDVVGFVRYMDDVVWGCRSRRAARATLEGARVFAWERLGLELKSPGMVQRSRLGVTLCGFRVFPYRLGLSRRRRRRYRAARARVEEAFARGALDGDGLQRGYDAALAVTAHAQARRMRLEDLARRPAPEV